MSALKRGAFLPTVTIRHISQSVQDRYSLEVAYTGFQLVPKLVALNDLERRNGRYFALFHRIRYLLGQLCYSTWLKLYHRRTVKKPIVYGNNMIHGDFRRDYWEKYVKERYPNSKAKIALVHHFVTISAISELLLYMRDNIATDHGCWLQTTTDRQRWCSRRSAALP